jgi:hypothetical protein
MFILHTMATPKDIKKKVRPTQKKLPPHSKCLICGLTKPLETSHIIPVRAFYSIPHVDKGIFLNYGCINTMTLCRNHHKLFDKGKLDKRAAAKIKTHVSAALVRLLQYAYEMGALHEIVPDKFYKDISNVYNTLLIYGKK